MSLPVFPRGPWPVEASGLLSPGAAISRGPTGAVRTRNLVAVGRSWVETFNAFDSTKAAGTALLEFIDRAWNEGLVFSISHPWYRVCRGTGAMASGGAMVAGANQRGNTLLTDGWAAGQTVLKQGDIFTVGRPSPDDGVSGLGPVLRCAADVLSDSSGHATISINPLIVVGNEPADDALLTVTAVLFRAVLLTEPVMPKLGASGLVNAGELQLTFAEVAG